MSDDRTFWQVVLNGVSYNYTRIECDARFASKFTVA